MAEAPGSQMSQARQPAAGSAYTWVQGLACGALLTFETASAILIVVLMAPGIASFIAEPGPNRSMTRAVGLGCAAATLGPVWHLWLSGNRIDGAFAILAQPIPLLLAWGAGACAWALCQVLPLILKGAWEASQAARVYVLQAELKRHREEWALDSMDPANGVSPAAGSQP